MGFSLCASGAVLKQTSWFRWDSKVTHTPTYPCCLNFNRAAPSYVFLTFVSLEKSLFLYWKCALSMFIHRKLELFLSWKSVHRYSCSNVLRKVQLTSLNQEIVYFPHPVLKLLLPNPNYCLSDVYKNFCLEFETAFPIYILLN